MLKRNALSYILAAAVLFGGTAAIASGPDDWDLLLNPGAPNVANMRVGVSPGAVDGYDGQPLAPTLAGSGVAMLMYRQNGPDWTGPTGFYYEDFASSIPAGATKTWANIYLWAQDYTVPAGNWIEAGPAYAPAPLGYTATLVLDYVPESMGWTGPTQFTWPARSGVAIVLPIPTVTDPLDGVRVHITVTAPIPEPSALAALGFSLLPLGGFALRRRRGM